MARALKVFRTAIGFHDAYVAASSRKAALAAWGTGKDLFASGSAELVTDPALMAEPLHRPGEVVRRSRGDLAEQLAAIDQGAVRSPLRDPPQATKPVKAKPRPSRASLDRIEAELRNFEREAQDQLAELRRREDALERERDALAQSQARQSGKLEARLRKARDKFEQAMSTWRADI